MYLIKRSEVKQKPLPGRVLQLAVGKDDAVVGSQVMTCGWATYSARSGPMQPHHHAEEVVVVLSTDRSYARYGGNGEAPTELGPRLPLEVGMVLHFPAMEWHVFEYEEGGHLDIMFYYSQSDVYSTPKAR
ncbi:MAG TPA: hypothetical protein VGA61_05640 [Anaerolineae bacterium]